MSSNPPTGPAPGPSRGRPRPRIILMGILRLATGHADGLAQFGDSAEAFLASLAPLIAFPLVGAVLMMLQGGGVTVLSDLLATLCALLAPPVLSYEAARFWGRADRWPRFAVAFNWCQWAIPVVAFVMVVLAGVLSALGLPRQAGIEVVVVGVAAYGLWLTWFLARHGLRLGGWQAAILVIGVNFVTVCLILGPQLLALAMNGAAGG